MKRILAVLLALVVLCAVVAVSVIAAESAGTIDELNAKIEAVESADGAVKKYNQLILALNYYRTHNFDACDQEQLAASVAKLKKLTVDVSDELITSEANAKAETRLTAYKKAQKLTSSIDLAGTEGYDALVTKMGEELAGILEKGMEYITYTPSEDPDAKQPTAADRKKNYDKLDAIVSDKDVDFSNAAGYADVKAAMDSELITIANAYLTEECSDVDTKYANILLAQGIVDSYDIKDVEGYNELLAAIDTNTLLTAKMYVEATTDSVFDRLANFGSASSILNAKDYSAIEGYDEVNAAVIEGSKTMFKAFIDEINYVQGENGYYNTAKNSTYLNRASYISKSLTSGWTDTEKAEAQALVAEKRTLHEQMKTANRALTEGGTDLQDYYLQVIMELQTFETFNDKVLHMENRGNQIIPYAFNGGSVLLINGQVDKCQTYFQNKSNFKTYTPDGLVLEFDIGTLEEFGNMTERVSIEAGGHEALDGSGKVYPKFFGIMANGELRLRVDQATSVVRENLIVPGEMVHFGMTYDQTDYTFKVYCEEEYVGTESATWNTGGKKFESLNVIRFDSQTGTGMNYILDNLHIYQGTGLRDVDKLNNMSEDEKFAFFANYLNDESRSISTRMFAYDKCEVAFTKYYSEAEGGYTAYLEGLTNEKLKASLKDAVAEYRKFDRDTVAQKFSDANRDTFIAYVEELAAIKRSPDTIIDRETLKTNITNFLTNNYGYVSQDDAFKQANNKLAILEQELAYDKNAESFVIQANRFELVSTIAAKQKYYNAMLEYRNDSTAPVNDELYKTYKSDEKLAASFEKFIKAYDVFLNALDEIDGILKDNTSQTIVDCVGFLTPIDESQWFEGDTYEYMNAYVLLVRDAITPNNDDSLKYNPDHEGVAAAIVAFKPIDEAFYLHLQQIHLAEINRLLGLIANTDAYIEKLGLTANITKYINENELDETNTDIQNALICYNTVLEELQYRTEDYKTVLKQNATTFNSLVRQMSYSTSYAAKKVLFDQATVYYFMLDASAQETKDMIAVYDEAKEYFASVETASEGFIETVAALLAATDAEERYELLTIGYEYSLTADASYDGVATALAAFNEIYDAYINSIEPDNAAIASISNILGSLRANGETSALADVLVRILAGK